MAPIAVLTAVLAFGAAGGASKAYIGLEHNVRGADFIVNGRVVEPAAKCDGRPYPFLIDAVYYGDLKAGQSISVKAVRNWTCQSRTRAYRESERLLLFLKRNSEGFGYRLVFGHDSEYLFPDKDSILGCGVYNGRLKRGAEDFLKLLPEVIAFAQLTTLKDVAGVWEGWLSSRNPEIVRFGLDRIYDCDTYEWASFQRRLGFKGLSTGIHLFL